MRQSQAVLHTVPKVYMHAINCCNWTKGVGVHAHSQLLHTVQKVQMHTDVYCNGRHRCSSTLAGPQSAASPTHFAIQDRATCNLISRARGKSDVTDRWLVSRSIAPACLNHANQNVQIVAKLSMNMHGGQSCKMVEHRSQNSSPLIWHLLAKMT